MKLPKCHKCGYAIRKPYDVLVLQKENTIAKGRFQHRWRCPIKSSVVELKEKLVGKLQLIRQ